MKRFVFSAALLLLASASWAQEIESKEEVKGEPSAALSALRLATELVKYGYSQQDALPLVQALQIINENPTHALNAEQAGEKANTPNPEGKDEMVSFDFEKILADAKEFAEGDETLSKLIAKVEKEKEENDTHRGAVNGPSKHYDVVYGNSTDTYNISFVGNYIAEILVSGDGDTDLDLYVYDSNGNLIAKDDDYTDDCYVRWTPAWTGRFTVRIVNRGPVYNRYVILTN